jgi:hypothetical protein
MEGAVVDSKVKSPAAKDGFNDKIIIRLEQMDDSQFFEQIDARLLVDHDVDCLNHLAFEHEAFYASEVEHVHHQI